MPSIRGSQAWEEAHQLGQEFARELAGRGRRAIVVTQIDGSTGCVHNHIVLDSIDRTTGKSFASSNVKHSVLAGTHDALLTKHGYEQINERHSTGWRLQEKSEERGLVKHREWRASDRSGSSRSAWRC
ncbi:relaxase/mobilization nuclease domain-containing protein [Tessaracoccus sp. HDW20]|uniref:relaxase/mobilization nuclease domain-containing protein n=1 Tax=Tessaracoccus coleopterorum TaxID=2714950 RepID=UPI0018D44EE6|nr:relaxase/mobilization nuclease domain-containing protein [Tessaracoccus coleopterorum]